MCVDTKDACLFSTGRSKIALGRAHSSDQAGCQTNRWSQQRERCFLASSQTWLQQSQRLSPTLDTAWQPSVVGADVAHTWSHARSCLSAATSDVTASERQNGGLDLTVQSCCSPQIIVTCSLGWGGGGGGGVVSSFHLSCVWFNLSDELWPLWTTRSKPHYLTAIFIHDFLCTGFSSHIYLHIATQTGNVKALHAG